MADVKISGLPASTVPLAGTEVLPIVQGGQTRQVSVNNLTTGKAVSATQYTSTIATGTAPLVVASTTEVVNLRAANATSADTANQVKSNATTGVLQVAGPATGTTRVMTTPDANFTAARTDAAQSFTGDQTLSTGNLVIGTSGKGIDFTATPGAGTSELLDDYEEGEWTGVPTFASGAASAVVFTGLYVKIGRQVTLNARWTMDKDTGSGAFTVTGLPFTNGASQGNYNGAAIGFIQGMGRSGFTVGAYVNPNTSILSFALNDANSANSFTALIGSDIRAGTAGVTFTITYQV
jgi:hypothetical protein